MKDDVKVTRERRENEANGSTAPYEADGRDETTNRRVMMTRVARAESPFTSNEEYYMGM